MWAKDLYVNVKKDSRWHSSNAGLVRTADALGDHFVWKLREAAPTDDAIARFASGLFDALRAYDRESRLLVKLADTGRVVIYFERAVDTALGMLNLLDSPAKTSWHQYLQQEREERVVVYETLLEDEDRLVRGMGDERQQLEVLTLLRHGLEQYGELVLSPRELDVMSAVYDAVARNWNGVTGVIPAWFATSRVDWLDLDKCPVDEGEEACLRQATLCATLHHPNVLKFYGACHVGRPFIIQSYTFSIATQVRWSCFFDCANGLAYVHDRGLVYSELALSHLRCTFDGKGVLTGLGLVRLRGSDGGVSSERDRELNEASNLRAFGLAIFNLLVKRRGNERDPKVVVERLPDARPHLLTEAEWELLTRMYAAGPTARICLEDAVYKMEALANEETETEPSAETNPSTTSEDVDMYVIPTAGQTFEEVFQAAGDLFGQVEEISDSHRPMYSRLINVYEQLQKMSAKPSKFLVEGFALIVWRFFCSLEGAASSSLSTVDTMCASRTIAGKSYHLHYQIDRLLRGTAELDSSDPVHRWQPEVVETRRRQHQQLQVCLEDPSQVLSQLKCSEKKAEAVAVLQFEAHNNGGTATRVQTATMEHHVFSATELPQWFIPAHQVELQGHIADGAFGAVFHGKWLGTDVVVKQVLADPSDSKSRDQVVQEANLWFKLNHENLVKLYGACHEGQPFFVCERAIHGTMASFVKGRSRKRIWWMIYQAAQGLQHLHECGIVHADLKGNNILISAGPTAKLADFGLSVVASHPDVPYAGEGAVGAFRWKAPECLLGAPPTFASDVYSFGMCIIEALTGVYPWGKSIPDEVVKLNVTKRKLIPPRPDSFKDAEWDLVTRRILVQTAGILVFFCPPVVAAGASFLLSYLFVSWLVQFYREEGRSKSGGSDGAAEMEASQAVELHAHLVSFTHLQFG